MLNGATGATINASGTTASDTISFTYSGAPTNFWDTGGARTLTLTGSNTGNNSFAHNIMSHSTGQTTLAKTGAGQWDVTSPHNSDALSFVNGTYGGYGGGTTLSAGTLAFANNALGGGVIDVTGSATLLWDSGNTMDISQGSGAGVTRSLKIEDGVTATLNVGANNVTLGSAIVTGTGATGALTKQGAGTLTLSAANTYKGATTVSAGTLALGAGGSIGASAVTVASSATLANATTTTCTIGGATTLSSGAYAAFTGAGGASSAVGQISITGNLTLSANVITVNVTGSALAAGSYRLMGCSGTVNGSANATPTITGTALASGYTATVSTTTGGSGHVDLIVNATPAFSGLTASPSITYGATSVSLSGTVEQHHRSDDGLCGQRGYRHRHDQYSSG